MSAIYSSNGMLHNGEHDWTRATYINITKSQKYEEKGKNEKVKNRILLWILKI